MIGGGFIAAAGGAGSPAGIAMDSCGRAAAGAGGAAAERRRLSCREVYARVSANAPTASAHKSSRLSIHAPMKRSRV
jgi:hypothetical protein